MSLLHDVPVRTSEGGQQSLVPALRTVYVCIIYITTVTAAAIYFALAQHFIYDNNSANNAHTSAESKVRAVCACGCKGDDDIESASRVFGQRNAICQLRYHSDPPGKLTGHVRQRDISPPSPHSPFLSVTLHSGFSPQAHTHIRSRIYCTYIYIYTHRRVDEFLSGNQFILFHLSAGIFRPTSKALASLYPRRHVWQGYLAVRLRRISHRRRFTVRRVRPASPPSALGYYTFTRHSSLYTLYTPPTTTTNTMTVARRHMET
ncbi:Uncharacterized protein FWK35_00035443 [Aphis craccivora]|uniref:Uncharacterized protein n=1 Tax=Aphis craccivora TaxID=307492 RepID=A0A6G0YBQ8_APHCR|nr:Uncharacterized protein FWK35_00035443 [Aphis craccivora]